MPLDRLILSVAWRNPLAVSNARINPARASSILASRQETMMKGMHRGLGLNEWLDRVDWLEAAPII
jgi:hypothetical protein